ncbi:MAG: hypothetical protein IPN86_11590 [Saprospiraceae bacterium]|nr:hypothetical protein [Saprospiraceae bacterium]
MKAFSKYFLFACFFVTLTTILPSCKTKEGCGQEEMYNNPDMETTKRGKSNLFSKSQNKRMKKKS